MSAPKVRKIVGEIVSISPLDSTEITLVSIQDSDNNLHTVSTSNKYWKAVGRFFQVGSIVAIEAEVRVKDTTEYTDAAGATQKHTSDGMNIAKVTAYSQSAWKSALTKKTIAEMETALNTVDVERANAFATFYGAALVAMKN